MIDDGTADRLLPLLISAITALVENGDVWLTTPTPAARAAADAHLARVEALGHDIAALAQAGRVVLRNRTARA